MADRHPVRAAFRALFRHLRLAFAYAGATAWSSHEASLVLRAATEADDASKASRAGQASPAGGGPGGTSGAEPNRRRGRREALPPPPPPPTPRVPPSAPDRSTPYAELAHSERRFFLELDELIRQEDGR